MHQIQNIATNNQLSDQGLLPRRCSDSESVDDDGLLPKLAGNVAQLGWVAGPAVIIFFSLVTFYTSALLCACYRSPVTSKRNHTYMDAIRSNLDGAKVKICLVIQYLNLLAAASEYTVFAALMMMHGYQELVLALLSLKLQVRRCKFCTFCSIILQENGRNFDRNLTVKMNLAWCVHGIYYTELPLTDGNNTTTPAQKILKIIRAVGDLAHAYDLSAVLIETMLNISPPLEAETIMKKATRRSLILTTFVCMLHGCLLFAAFGNNVSPRVFLLHGFYKPYWQLDMIASAAIVIQFSGGYQIYLLPILTMVEEALGERFPDNEFITKDIKIPTGCKLNLFRLVWRTLFVITTTVLSMFLTIYVDLLKLVQILAFWPIAVYFPVEMYMVQKKIPKWSKRWTCLQILTVGWLIVTIATAAASSVDIFSTGSNYYDPFKPKYF
ncbi:amino acid permease 3-like [Carya illinoinensis]|uniref:amino acid permease 3-like n=1 Tax=Carya illinoinensis TaxID=32201 RepID=UPI001C71D083|nr:amino acid permease 3-like [Carya illinoinensis]